MALNVLQFLEKTKQENRIVNTATKYDEISRMRNINKPTISKNIRLPLLGPSLGYVLNASLVISGRRLFPVL